MVAESSDRRDVKYSGVDTRDGIYRPTTIPTDTDSTETSTRYSMRKQIFATLVATLGCLLNGAVIGFTGPAIPSLLSSNNTVGPVIPSLLRANHTVGRNDFSVWGKPLNITLQTASWITGIMSVGCFLGCLIAGPTMDKLGRKKTLMFVTCGNFVVGFLLIILANGPVLVMAGRFMSGLGLGFVLAVVSVYIVEIASTDMRGFLGCFVQFLGSIGVLLTFSLGAILNWVQLAAAHLIMVIPFFLGLLCIPESPRWLIMKGNEWAGEESLKWLRGRQPQAIDMEIEQIKKEIALKKRERASISQLAAPDVLKPFAISLAMMFFLQMSGSNVMVFYSNTIFALVGSSIDPSYASIILGTVLLASCFVAMAVVSKCKRKLILVTSMVCMSICYFVLGAILHNPDSPVALPSQLNQTISVSNTSLLMSPSIQSSENSATGWIATLAVICVVFCGNGGYGTLIWVVTAELLPAKVRSVANSVIICFAFVIGFIVSKTFVDLVESVELRGAFFMYGSICVVGAIFTAVAVPETKGKSSEEIQAYFCRRAEDEKGGVAHEGQSLNTIS